MLWVCGATDYPAARVLFGQWVADLYKPEHEWGRAVFSHQAVNDELIHGIAKLMASV